MNQGGNARRQRISTTGVFCLQRVRYPCFNWEAEGSSNRPRTGRVGEIQENNKNNKQYVQKREYVQGGKTKSNFKTESRERNRRRGGHEFIRDILRTELSIAGLSLVGSKSGGSPASEERHPMSRKASIRLPPLPQGDGKFPLRRGSEQSA